MIPNTQTTDEQLNLVSSLWRCGNQREAFAILDQLCESNDNNPAVLEAAIRYNLSARRYLQAARLAQKNSDTTKLKSCDISSDPFEPKIYRSTIKT